MGCIKFLEKVISQFESYLSGRIFKVNIEVNIKVNKKLSDQEILLAAFPKDLYLNGMPQAVKCDLFLYADDTCLTFRHENVKEIED